MSEADCAQMIVKLRYFEGWQARRKLIADYYTSELSNYVVTPDVHPNVEHAWSKYVIHHKDRMFLANDLSNAGIETKINYPKPLHLHTLAFAYDIEYNIGILEGAEEFSKTCLSLPIYPELTDAEVEQVVETIRLSMS
jgi:dTDP-4-amino-4,6-dideoxygalactose transaminase